MVVIEIIARAPPVDQRTPQEHPTRNAIVAGKCTAA